MATPSSRTVERALSLLTAIVEDRGTRSFAELAVANGFALATAHRLAASIEKSGFVVRQRGTYLPGPTLVRLAAVCRFADVVAGVSRAPVRQLARELGTTAHVGLLEDDMVTYVVKESGGRQSVFTQEGMQLEAYCSAIGKVLLAHLPDGEREAYLSGAGFVALTANTIVDPLDLNQCFEGIRAQGHAVDDAEVTENLRCVAVPIRDADGIVCAAVSVSTADTQLRPAFMEGSLARLSACAAAIEVKLAAGRTALRAAPAAAG